MEPLPWTTTHEDLMREPPRPPDLPEDEYVWVPEAMGWCPREEPAAWIEERRDINELCDQLKKERLANPSAHQPISIYMDAPERPTRRKSRREQPDQLSLFDDDAPPANEPLASDDADDDGLEVGYP